MAFRRTDKVSGGILAGAALLLAAALALAGCTGSSSTAATPPGTSTGAASSTSPGGEASVDNGRQIYLYAVDDTGEPVTYTGGPGMMMYSGGLSCATCHGENGHGGQVYFMMQSFDVPNITWPELTGPHMDHPPYTVGTVERAITQGLDPAGEPLEYPMPRWQMSAADLDDLLAFMMTLK
jgi:cytochrome c oxidase subunit 2